ncbi:MAG: DUF2207 domain-containing protein [Candidatus Roizmanbacteria bacterium]
MKKILICFLLFFTIVFTVAAEEIKSFQSDIKINKDGTIDVKETITYDFGDLSKHGIYREIPFIKTNQDGKKFELKFNNFFVVDDFGIPYEFVKSSVNEKYTRLKIGDADRLITGVHKYIISYRVSGALTYFSDHDELYWNVTGNEWDVPIANITSQVIWPQEIQKQDVKIACFTGVTGSSESQCNFDHDRDKVRINSINSLSAGEGLTIVIGFPKNIVAVLEPKEFVSFWQTFIGKLVGFFLGLLALIWYVVLPFYIVYKWFKSGRDPKGTVGETTAWFDPPKTPDNKRFLTPGEVGTLGDETVDLKDISATIVDLARRGYLIINEKKKKDFYFIKNKEYRNNPDLLPYEEALLNAFFTSKAEIRLKDEKIHDQIEAVKNSLYNNVVKVGLFPQNPQTTRTIYYVIALIAIFTGNLPLAFVSFIFGRAMPRKTVEGVNAFNVSKSLKNFLTSQERQLKFQADKQIMFERLLPYAIAFGVEKIWAKRFENVNIKQPSWYQGYSGGQFSSLIFVNSLSSSMSSFRTVATPIRSSSGFSSGFSGGFSGGGGGGGGGGSW